MAAQNAELDESSLSSLFKSLWGTYVMIEETEESTSSDKIQGELRKALAKAEQAIFMVNQLQLFSDNEEIEEVATNEVRYMLLPALLGYFHALNTHASRLDTVLKAKTHYKDFLKMCKSYKVSSQHIPLDVEEDDDQQQLAQAAPPARPGGMDMQSMASQRNSKIERFRQNKELEGRLKELSDHVEKDSVDDEVKREFYLTQVKRWINRALDEVDSLNSEVQILQHMAQMKKQGKAAVHEGATGDMAAKPAPKKAFRPFILTKDAIQKQVFGLGYPGVPTMSIEEFYQQKVSDGTFSIPHTHASQSLQGRAADPERAKKEEEKEEEEKERRTEEDDPELLQRARNMDEFKDDHRRGWGNRKNMG